jgi:hypothetical protein
MAGVNWYQWNAPSNVFFTRMHVRYDEAHFPADLQFQVTPNTEHYQARYVVINPAPVYDGFGCPEGQQYLMDLHNKRKLELDEYYALCGMTYTNAKQYLSEYDRYLSQIPEEWKEPTYQELREEELKKGEINPMLALPKVVNEVMEDESKRDGAVYFLMLVGLVVLVVWKSNQQRV